VVRAVRSGNWRALVASFIYFDHSFSVWLLLGALGPFVAEALGLSGLEKGYMVAVPVIAAAVFRINFGYLFQHWDGRIIATVGILLSLVPHAYLLLSKLLGFEVSYTDLLWMGVFLGVAGASFAVALPMAGSNYPKEYQGLVLGLAAAGNVGAVLDGVLFPPLAELIGWEWAFVASSVLLFVALALVLAWAKDATAKGERSLRPWLAFFATLTFTAVAAVGFAEGWFGVSPSVGKLLLPVAGALFAVLLMPPVWRRVFLERDTWVLMLAYSITFGGFVGMSSYVAMLLTDAYGVSKVEAGLLMSLFAFTGALIRPLGGFVADKVSGATAVPLFVAGIALVNLAFALFTPPLALATVLFLLLYTFYGLGNGAVFQLVPHRWPDKTGLMTGIVGAAGGIGGFYLPTVNGLVYDYTGSYNLAFLLFGLVALFGVAVFLLLHRSYKEWSSVGGKEN